MPDLNETSEDRFDRIMRTEMVGKIIPKRSKIELDLNKQIMANISKDIKHSKYVRENKVR